MEKQTIFFPGQRVPKWLNKIYADGYENENVYMIFEDICMVEQDGKGKFHVFKLGNKISGVMRVVGDEKGMYIQIEGQGKGVCIHSDGLI